MGNNNSVKRIAAALGGVCFFGFFVCTVSSLINIGNTADEGDDQSDDEPEESDDDEPVEEQDQEETAPSDLLEIISHWRR